MEARKLSTPSCTCSYGTWLFDRCTAPGTQGEWKIDETLTDLITHHQVEPIIVVGIDSTANRDVELAPFGNPIFYGGPKVFQGTQVPEFLTDEVLPYVAAHYRVKQRREHTGVGGSSLGGVAALTALLKRPDVFGIGLLESTSMQYGNGDLLRETMPVVMGPVRVSIGLGSAALIPTCQPGSPNLIGEGQDNRHCAAFQGSNPNSHA
jgi:hypothetical protein